MALKKNMTLEEMVNFIDHELLPQTKQEFQLLRKQKDLLEYSLSLRIHIRKV